MKSVQKYFFLNILSAVLLLVAAAVGVMAHLPRPQRFSTEVAWPEFHVASSDGFRSERVTIYDAGDGNCYVFLPSYAEFDRVTVTAGKGKTYALGGAELPGNGSCENFRTGIPYAFTADGEHLGNLWFRRSENIPAMYIDTISGTVRELHRDTFPEELAGARLYTAGGDLDYLEDYAAIKCRGYTSAWLDKKSYTLSLEKSTGLLGMGNSEKWTLTANGYDPTHLRNKTVYSFADLVAPYPAWAPDCAYTELYLNGEYAGLYLLCQKPDTGPDHLNLAPEDYYFELTTDGRTGPDSVVVEFCSYKIAEVIFPKKCAPEQADFLETKLEALHEVLLAEEETPWQDYIDMDSWTRKYLLEEAFRNSDGGRASIYFTYDTSEDRFYVGHCWDYDATLGALGKEGWDSPHSMPVKRGWRTGDSWFTALYRKEAFKDAFTEIYEKEFRPLLLEYARDTIPEFAQQIRSAVQSEYLRWPQLYPESDWDTAVEGILDFLQERISFLDALWLEHEVYYEIEVPSEYNNLDIHEGLTAEELPKNPYRADGIWYLEGTDTPFDVTQTLTADVRLSPFPASEIPLPAEEVAEEAVEAAPKRGYSTQEYITIASIALFQCALLLFVAADIFQRRKDRRNTDTPTGHGIVN